MGKGLMSPLDHLSDEGFAECLSILTWITVIVVGFATELTMGPVLIRRKGISLQYWKYAQLLFPLLATVSLQAAARRDPICLITLALGLWKFGFPETSFYLTKSFDRKEGWTIAVCDFLDGVGVVMHHSSASLIIAQLCYGRFMLSRHISAAIFPLIVQHWFALTRYRSSLAYTLLTLASEVWFQWEVYSNFEYLTARTALAGATLGMISAHWMYIVSACVRLVLRQQSNNPQSNRPIIQIENSAEPADFGPKGTIGGMVSVLGPNWVVARSWRGHPELSQSACSTLSLDMKQTPSLEQSKESLPAEQV
jgi:hypothetical protein